MYFSIFCLQVRRNNQYPYMYMHQEHPRFDLQILFRLISHNSSQPKLEHICLTQSFVHFVHSFVQEWTKLVLLEHPRFVRNPGSHQFSHDLIFVQNFCLELAFCLLVDKYCPLVDKTTKLLSTSGQNGQKPCADWIMPSCDAALRTCHCGMTTANRTTDPTTTPWSKQS